MSAAVGAAPPQLKFCGLTRPEDARRAAELGAAYVGCVFAGGPRLVTADRARDVAAPARALGARAVGVMGAVGARAVANLAAAAGLDAVQLHADPDAAAVDDVRRHWGGAVWAVLRVRADARAELPARAAELFGAADAVVLDAKVEGGALGGSGVALPWAALADALAPLRGRTPLVLAGGLRPENVADAVAALAPDLVDVSSGVELAPGVKDHARMAAFAAAARQPVVL